MQLHAFSCLFPGPNYVYIQCFDSVRERGRRVEGEGEREGEGGRGGREGGEGGREGRGEKE